jgi:hypothetical protein
VRLARATHLIQDTVLRHPRERVCPQGLTDEVPLHQVIRGRADHDRIRCGQPLNFRGQMERRPDGQLPIRWSPLPCSHDYQARVNPDPYGEAYAKVLEQPMVEVADRR